MENKRFDAYKKYFRKYQERFGLDGYKVEFACRKLKDSCGEIEVWYHDALAKTTVSRCTHPGRPVRVTAKHEALHLLLARFAEGAFNRYTTKDELESAEEEVIHKLERLIPN